LFPTCFFLNVSCFRPLRCGFNCPTPGFVIFVLIEIFPTPHPPPFIFFSLKLLCPKWLGELFLPVFFFFFCRVSFPPCPLVFPLPSPLRALFRTQVDARLTKPSPPVPGLLSGAGFCSPEGGVSAVVLPHVTISHSFMN